MHKVKLRTTHQGAKNSTRAKGPATASLKVLEVRSSTSEAEAAVAKRAASERRAEVAFMFLQKRLEEEEKTRRGVDVGEGRSSAEVSHDAPSSLARLDQFTDIWSATASSAAR